jgi:hypothetical protein
MIPGQVRLDCLVGSRQFGAVAFPGLHMSIDVTEPSPSADTTARETADPAALATTPEAAVATAATNVAPAAPAAHDPLHVLLGGSVERRANGRHYLHQRAELWAPGQAASTLWTTDISLGGVGLVHDDPIGPPGALAELRLSYLGPSCVLHLSLQIRLCYTRIGHMGLRTGAVFVQLSEEQRGQLSALIVRHPSIH